MGVSEALYIPAGLSLIADYHTEKSRSLAVGIHMTGLYTGQAIGGFGATVAAAFSWHTTFHWFGIIGIAYALVLVLFLKDKKEHVKTERLKPSSKNGEKAGLFKGLSLLFSNIAFWVILLYLQHLVCRVGLLRIGCLLCSLKILIFQCHRPDLCRLSRLHYLHLLA